MTFRLPDSETIKALAGDLGHTVGEQEAQLLSQYMAAMCSGYAYLDSVPDHLPPVTYAERRHWFPADQDNPLGAWYVQASIKGAESGPLSGKRVAVKDNIFVAGVPMMAGSTLLQGFVPDYDAAVVTRLLESGAEIVGKSVCECLCLSGGSATAATGMVRNPRDTAFSTGGSSSGSAALVAAGEVDMALGTDQGGSVRIPSSWTGICGMKATRGVVPYSGGLPMETSIDYIGPMTSTVADNALMLGILAGHAPEEYTRSLGRSIDGMTIGVLKEGFGHPLSEPAVDECVRAAADRLGALGAGIEEVSLPIHLQGPAIWGAVVTDGYWRTFSLNGLGYNYEGVYSPALHAAMEGWTERFHEQPFNAKLLFLLGKYMERYQGAYYAKAKNLVWRLQAAYEEALRRFDLLLMPTTVQQASRNPASLDLENTERIMAQAFNNTFNACQFNATGHPAMSIPCGLRNGMPVGLMLVGRYFAEDCIYQAAHAFEQSADWETR